MRKVTEKDILAFTYEFVKKVWETDKDLLYCYSDDYDYVMRFGKNEIMLDDVSRFAAPFEIPIEEIRETLPGYVSPAEYHVREYDSDEDHECIAYLCIEGDLYGTLNSYDAYGFGGEKAKELWWALNTLSDKYGMVYSWCGGAIAFYDAEEYRLS